MFIHIFGIVPPKTNSAGLAYGARSVSMWQFLICLIIGKQEKAPSDPKNIGPTNDVWDPKMNSWTPQIDFWTPKNDFWQPKSFFESQN